MEINRTFLIKTLGCKVNQTEGEALREKFLRMGYEEARGETGLDVVIINTCTVTANADRESRALIRRFHRLNPQAEIVVTGCYAEKNGEVLSGMEGVRLVVSQNEKEFLVDRFLASSPLTLNASLPSLRYQDLPISEFKYETRGFIKIQDGCDRNCSYCKVKIVRGPSRSRPWADVFQEAQRLVHSGVREIVLAGIQLGAYGDDFQPKLPLSELVERLLEIPELLRIRLSSIEPGDVTEELIDLMAHDERLAKQMHIPLQSGNNEILKKMKRGYTREYYLDLIAKIESRTPDFCLSFDAMAGFPGESPKAFQDTLEVVEKTRPLKVHIFPYSPREGTAAFHFPGALSVEAMNERLSSFAETAEGVSRRRKRDFMGKRLRVLVEEYHRSSGRYRGRTTHLLPVTIASTDNLINQEVEVEAAGLEGDFIRGVVQARNF
jgi:threonylcarbamoyladenosine tRNA methylthiotransferase MtaB